MTCITLIPISHSSFRCYIYVTMTTHTYCKWLLNKFHNVWVSVFNTYSTAQRRPRASSARCRAHRLWIYRVNNSDRNSSIHVLLYDVMFSWLTMLQARIAFSHKSTYIHIYNKLNIMSYNSACIELLRSLLFTLYIHSLCVRSWLVDNDAGRYCTGHNYPCAKKWTHSFLFLNSIPVGSAPDNHQCKRQNCISCLSTEGLSSPLLQHNSYIFVLCFLCLVEFIFNQIWWMKFDAPNTFTFMSLFRSALFINVDVRTLEKNLLAFWLVFNFIPQLWLSSSTWINLLKSN